MAAVSPVTAQPLFVVLVETGEERDGYPVYRVDPDGAHVAEALSRGFSGGLLRGGTDFQPAMVALTLRVR